jgi:general transcription factor 3C polypeptide 2
LFFSHICSEWKHFNYEPRTVRFASEVGSLEGKDVVSGINLPQFSSATVPKVN